MTPRVLVTRPAAQSAEMAELLAARHIDAVCVPTVEIDRASAERELDLALDRLAGAAWLVITSANGGEALVERLAARDQPLPEDVRIAAVGPATAEAISDAGLPVDHVPDEYLTLAIAEGLGELAGRRVVLARADAATPDLHDALVARGAQVEEVVAYRTVEGPASSRDPLRAAMGDRLDGIAFTSGSTVRGLLRLASPLDRTRVRNVPAFCIGPVTAATARGFGFEIAGVAEEHTAAGLADAIAAHIGTDNQ